MKKTIILIIFLFTLQSTYSQSNIIKANPLGIVFGIANAGYEKTINNNQSITISGTYFKESIDEGDGDVNGFGADAKYNFYFSSSTEAPVGFHVGPGIGVLFLSDDKDDATVVSFNALAGYQWVLWQSFAIDIFAQYDYITDSNFSGVDSSYIGIGLSLGYAW
ncbi:DUF3575 domain-containing protein [Aquimarina sediminis]|uniref:DUF3575 domain-containing protein n=1 Tax=Aquimarina sediminis TaxID=2070536 RepID=UPI000CA03F28|nr:DUF3575 domain-containing protein [Aquimarina sediminis]